MDYKQIVDKYIKDIQSGDVVTCKWVKLAVERHLKDLERDDIYFDEESAVKFLKFSSLCRYTKGELAKQKKRIEFSPQQLFRYWNIFGWKKKDGTRRFRKIYVEVARKNGKSEEGAVVCAYMLLKDGEHGAEIYTAATKHDQAKIVFDAAKEMIRKLREDSATVRELTTMGVLNVAVLSTNSKLEPISSRSEKQDGLNPHLGVIDEYHAHSSSDLLEVIQTGMGSRSQPLLLIITTAGFEKQYPCYTEERATAIDILSGVKQDDSFFAVIYTLDEGDDWRDESVWIKANPNIGITPTWEFMRQQCQQAINQGVIKEVQFKTKNLNIWTDSSMAWINNETWMACKGEMPDLTGRECYAGLDLAAVSDMNAYVLVFPNGDDFYIKPYFWLPRGVIEAKGDHIDYRRWVNEGLIKVIDGDVIDQRIILNDILDIHKQYNVKSFAFDRFMAFNGLIQGLNEEGINGYEFGQGFRSMSEPTKDLEVLVKSNKIMHDGNGVLAWQMSNVELETDPADNVKPSKKKSRNKIDGVVALVMALGCYHALNSEKKHISVYEERGLREL